MFFLCRPFVCFLCLRRCRYRCQCCSFEGISGQSCGICNSGISGQPAAAQAVNVTTGRIVNTAEVSVAGKTLYSNTLIAYKLPRPAYAPQI